MAEPTALNCTPTTPPHLLRHHLQTSGFVIIRSIIPPSSPFFSSLVSAAVRTTQLARSGKWPHVRTTGKQFPPWTPDPSNPSHIWGVQHILHPDLPDSPLFLKSYFSSFSTSSSEETEKEDESSSSSSSSRVGVLDIAKSLLSQPCTDQDLCMELYNMLVRPLPSDYELRWHRDDIPPTATTEEEEERLCPGQDKEEERQYYHAQWNLALFEDSSLIVVPGSHKRARNEKERAATEYEDPLEGQLVVGLGPGDCVFYDNNILHRGKYDSGKERMSLHGSVGHVGGGNKGRARNVLQHGVGDWVEKCDLKGALLAEEGEEVLRRAEGMRERLVVMGRESGDVGFSQEG